MTTIRQYIRILALMVTSLSLVPVSAFALESTGETITIESTVVDSITPPTVSFVARPLGTTDNKGYPIADILITSQDDATSSFNLIPDGTNWKNGVLTFISGSNQIAVDVVQGQCKQYSALMKGALGFKVANLNGFETGSICTLRLMTNNESPLPPGDYKAIMTVTALTN